ncbi:MAG: Bug family tripartite tricarboxylate transporter substrate binding protein [Lautropia sp.]
MLVVRPRSAIRTAVAAATTMEESLRSAAAPGAAHRCTRQSFKETSLMPSLHRCLLAVAVAAATCLTAAAPAQAQDNYPDRPIRLVVAAVAGGTADILARSIAERMRQSMGQPVVVDNKPGAGQTLGTAEVARARPDGYTIQLGTSSSHAINPAVFRKLPYDVLKDFSFVTTVALSDYALSVPASSPFKSVGDLLKGNSKEKPLRYASNGNGSTSHLASALLGVKAGQEFIHVPYKSSAPAMTDLMSGQVDFLIDNTAAAQANEATGRIRILATTARERGPKSRNIPTLIEAGVPDYEVIGWFAMIAPAGTPAPIVNRLNQEIAKALNDPEVNKRMTEMGNPPLIKTPEETTAFVKSEIAKFKAVTSAIDLQLD